MRYNYIECSKRYGEIEHNGKKYALVDNAELTSRMFTNCWSDADQGEEYKAEFSASAIDSEGNEYEAYWMFDAVKGEEPENADEWPWEDKYISRIEPR